MNITPFNTLRRLKRSFLAMMVVFLLGTFAFAQEPLFDVQGVFFNEALGVLEVQVDNMPQNLVESDYRSVKLTEPLNQFVVSFPRAKSSLPKEKALPIGRGGLTSVVFSQSSPYSGALMRVNFDSTKAVQPVRFFPTTKGFVLSLSGQLPPQIAAYQLSSTNKPAPASSSAVSAVFVPNQNLKQINRAFLEGRNVVIESAANDQLEISNRTVLNDPSRLVLDIAGAQLAGSGKLDPVTTPDATIERVRFGQFDDQTVRIVVDTSSPESVTVTYPPNGARNQLVISATSGGQSVQTLPASNQQVGVIQDIWVQKMPDGKTAIKLSASVPIVRNLEKNGSTITAQFSNLIGREAPVYFEQRDFPFIRNIRVLPFQATEPNVKLVVSMDRDDVSMEQFLSNDGKYFQILLTPKEGPAEVSGGALPRAPGKKLIVVDAGHGGKDAGANREGIYEKTITLATALKLTKVLESMGYQVVMTRNVDKFLELSEITAITNRVKPDLFVSVHVNAMVKTDIRGIETYYYWDRSLPLAKAVHKQLISRINSPDRSVRKAKFYVINHTNVPAILCEMGYISNVQERSEIVTAARQQATAEAIARGITDFLKAQK